MIDIVKKFKEICDDNEIEFSIYNSIKSYDNSTLFCSAGMQQYADLFKKKWLKGTVANIQSCLRTNDIDKIGDGSHLAYFNMIGLFSFRELTMKEAVNFWISFLEKYLKLRIEKITIHPKKIKEWSSFINKSLIIEPDKECSWTDGKTFGYCMEFYINGIEVGNIVNTEGDCIDAGFGLERLDIVCNKIKYSKEKVIKDTIEKIISEGIKPSNLKQGYILRKLLNLTVRNKIEIKHHYYQEEIERIKKMKNFYFKNKDKFKEKDKKWWKETHGVDLDYI